MARKKKKFTTQELDELFTEYTNTLSLTKDEYYKSESDLAAESFKGFLEWMNIRNSKTAIHAIDDYDDRFTQCTRLIVGYKNESTLQTTVREHLVTCKQCIKKLKAVP